MLESHFPLSRSSLSYSWRQRLFLATSFLLPALLFFAYFAGHDFNVLTVDLGQQYIDFFAFLRQNLFSHPLQLIYTFENGLGGPMLGTVAYYLASPFNLLIFFFSPKYLPLALLLIITLKIGSIGLTAYYYWQEKVCSLLALAASLAYSLSSYVVANHFNLMWLDALILLPLLIQNIDRLLKGRKNHLLLVTFLLWVTNFYVGIMALFFGFLYFLSSLFQAEANRQKLIAYLKKSISGTFLAAFLLLPAFTEILANESSHPQLEFAWQFSPLKEVAKLTIGSYNFQQMQTGLPNIYFTTPFLFLTILYFTSRQIKLRPKLINLGLLLFLILSLSFQPLVLFWHLGQFPTWYPGRFTFVLIFFCLNLAVIYLSHKEKLLIWQKLLLVGIAAIFWSYCCINKNSFSFLSQNNLLLTGLFLILALLFICLVYPSQLAPSFLFLIILAETSCNLICCFNNLAYQNSQDYENFRQNTTQITTAMRRRNSGLYRAEKTFSRSDDDAFTAGYNGIGVFNSLINQKTLNFLAQLGYLHNSNSVVNNGGTPISDAILGVKYYIQQNIDSGLTIKPSQKMKFANFNQRSDISGPLITSNSQLVLEQNQAALPLLFLGSASPGKFAFQLAAPLLNQQNFWRAATGQRPNLIKQINWAPSSLPDKRFTKGKHRFIKISSQHPVHQLFITISSKTLADYYLQLPAGLDQSNLTLQVNKKRFNLSVRDSQAHLLNLGCLTKGQKISLHLASKEGPLNLKDVVLWQINPRLLNKEAQRFKAGQPAFCLKNGLTIKSKSFQIKKGQKLVTTIPYSKDWLIFDTHQLFPSHQFARTFLTAYLPRGKHQLTLIYVPFAFLLGLFISLLTLFLLLFWVKQK